MSAGCAVASWCPDASGAGVEADARPDLERAASDTVKRVLAPRRAPDFTAAPGTMRLRAFLETKTVWHPVGAISLAGGSAY